MTSVSTTIWPARRPASTGLPVLPFATQADFEELEKRVEDLGKRIAIVQNSANSHSHDSADIDLHDTNYSRVDTASGILYVSVPSSAPYLDGMRLRMTIGNPMAVSFRGIRLDIGWRAADEETWATALQDHSTKVKLAVTLLSGRWNTVTVDLPGAKPEKVRYLSVSIETESALMPR